MEDENTGYQTLAPVSNMFNLIARFHVEGSDCFSYKEHMLKRQDFMWIGPEGVMCGTNGSQLWDAAFTTQAMLETGWQKRKRMRKRWLRHWNGLIRRR